MNYNRAELKRTAKELVRTTRPKVWLTTLIYILLTTVAVRVVTTLVPNPLTDLTTAMQIYPDYFAENPEMLASMLGAASGGMMLTVFVSVLTSLYQAVMRYGYVGYTLKVWRREAVAHTDIFSGFPMAGPIIGASIMVGIFSFLWGLLVMLGYIVLVFVAVALSEVLELLGYLMLILAIFWLIAGIFLIFYRYSLTPYFLMSDPDLDIFQAITASKTAMRGNYKKRFVLDLSFLGWSLLEGLITLAVMAVGFIVIFWGSFDALSFDVTPTTLLVGAGVPGILVMILAFVIALPLTLWLTSYIRVTETGFFETVKGLPATQSRLQRHIAGASSYAYGGVPPIPPAPPVPPEPAAPEAPADPEEAAGEEPATPEEPAEPTDEAES